MNPLPILPHSSSPILDEAPICIQNWFAELLHVCEDGSTNIAWITFPHPDKPSDDEHNDSDQENIAPPYQRFHVLVHSFKCLEEYIQQFPSQTMLTPTKLLLLPSLKSTTPLTMEKNTSETLRKLSELPATFVTVVRPVKMMKRQLLLCDSIKSDDWNLNLPFDHHLPLMALFRHLLYSATRKSQ